MIIDLGCGDSKVKGSIGVDFKSVEGVDIIHDLNTYPYPFKDEVADKIFLLDVIEHINNTIKTIEECYRILKPAGKLIIRVVYWNHRHAWSDPTHVKAFNQHSFDFFIGKRPYYTEAQFSDLKIRYIYDSKALQIFKNRSLIRKLSRFLCNTIQGMNIELTK